MSPGTSGSSAVQPDISNIDIAPELLLECVRRWERCDYKGAPPDPVEIMLESVEQNQVTIMANYVHFRRNKSKRDDSKRGGIPLEDI